MDNLKTVLVAWVIGGHALLGYTAVGGWPYDEVNEVTLEPHVELVLTVLIGPAGLFMMGTFFFIAGLFLPQSFARRGTAQFARERLVRLGIPFAVSAVLVWPAAMWLAYRASGRPVSFWWALTHRDPLLDSGSLWFAAVLLLFSLAYAAGHTVVARASEVPRLNGWNLVAWAGAIALTTFVVRLGFPARSGQVGDLHVWQWPQLAGMFLLGIVAGRLGWAQRVPDGLWRGCRTAMLVTLAVLPVFAVLAARIDLADTSGHFLGGPHWQSALAAVAEGGVVVAGSVWLLGLAQRRLTREGRLHQAAFAAFVLQGPVLITIAVAVRPLAVPAEVKAVLVAAAAIGLSFWLGQFVVTRTPLGRVL